MPKRLSFQLYSARDHTSLADTMKVISEAGYKEVEGYGGVYSDAAGLKALMDAHGLTMPTGHFGISELENDKKGTLKILKTLGIRHIYSPYIAAEDRPNDGAGWRAFGKRLGKIAAFYRGEGYSFGWHNHDFEFVALADGKTPHEMIFKGAPLLDWEIDVAWVIRGGADPVKFIKKYAGNITAAHIKDIAVKGKKADEDGWEDVGHGTVDWKPIMAALKKTRIRHYVIEHDKPSDTARFAKRSFEAASKL
ncbi:MAG: sugar phosphate isomerase/epimerase family protein [Rhizobiaceae bacterium]